MCPGEHERSIRAGDDREPAASPVHPGRSGGLPVSGLPGNLQRSTRYFTAKTRNKTKSSLEDCFKLSGFVLFEGSFAHSHSHEDLLLVVPFVSFFFF